MSLKKEIIALLKTKFPGVQLSAARVEAIATKIDAKITTAEEIEAKLDEANELFPFADIAKQDDRIRSLEEEAKKKKPADEKGDNPKKEEPKVDETPTEKMLREALDGIKSLTSEVASIKGEKVTNTRRATYLESLKGTSKEYQEREMKKFDRMKFETDEEFNEFLTEAKELHADAIQDDALDGVGNDKPLASSSGNASAKRATDAELDEVMGELKI